MYVLQSNFNHSCLPNCAARFGPTAELTMIAKRDVRAGDELTITYLSDLHLALETYQQRRERLSFYFFECKCERCTKEEEHGLRRFADPSVPS